MKGRAVTLEEIRVERLHGFEPPGFVVGGFGEGINVVWGPNAAGKSTLARALAMLLWPKEEAPPRAIVAGRLRIGGDPWVIRVDAGAVRREKGGVEAEMPSLPPPSARDRYRLSLHELLQRGEGNRSFADAVLRESRGGYRIDDAKQSLGFRPEPSMPRGLVAKLREAESRLGEARRRLLQLSEEEERLEGLREDLAVAEDAGRRVELLSVALEHARARDAALDGRRALDGYPEILGRMTGREGDEVAELRREVQGLRDEIRDLQRDAAGAREEQQRAALPPEGVSDSLLASLRERLNEVAKAEAQISKEELDLAAARERLALDARLLGDAVEPDRVSSLDLSGLRRIAEIARRGEDLRGRRRAVVERIRLLQRSTGSGGVVRGGTVPEGSGTGEADAASRGQQGDAGRGVDVLRDACAILRRWLRSPEPTAVGEGPSLKGLALAGGLIAAVLGPLLVVLEGRAWLGSWAWVLGTLAGVPGLAIAALSLRGREGVRTPQHARAVHEASFRALGVEGPPRWIADDVERWADDLERRLAGALLAEEKARAAQDLVAELREADRQLAAAELERREVADALGVSPGTGDESLFWLVETIGRYQSASAQAAAAAARLAEAASQRASLLNGVCEGLQAFGYRVAADQSEASSFLDDLHSRRSAADRAAARLREAERSIDRSSAGLRDKEAAAAARFAALGLAPGDDATLERWCVEHAAYQEAHKAYEAASRDVAGWYEKLRHHALFDERLASAPVSDLEIELERARVKASGQPGLLKEIASIETRIAEAKMGHAVEEALAEHDACLGALAEQARADYAAVVGSVLAEHIDRRTRDAERPHVFHQARRLFAEVTRGRYRLELEAGKEPGFRAVDESTGLGLSLDELSSGTRVQLLLAVRMAFVEMEEEGLALPLVLDETLANSDAVRSGAVMEAVLELAREGRQILCLTAQEDEVLKWEALIAKTPEVPYRRLDLAEIRRLDRADAGRFRAGLVSEPHAYPLPGAMRHEEYGRVLGVPPIDPFAAGSTHVWHVVEEPRTLHELLRLGVEEAAQLRTLIGLGGRPLLGPEDGDRRRVEAALRALEVVCELARRGRGRRVDRAALLDSGALTDVFLDEVTKLAASVDGDAHRLLEALLGKRVKRLRADSVERLAAFLEEEGYLPPENPLSGEEQRVQAAALLADDLQSGALEPATLDRLFSALVAP